jgi:hypothetical protein
VLSLESLVAVPVHHPWQYSLPGVPTSPLHGRPLFLPQDRPRMGLESYRDDAREALAIFLRHTVTGEGRFYGVMLPAEHPFSFCQLLGLSTGERDCLFSACSFLMSKALQAFSPIKFGQFSSSYVDLQAIQGSRTVPHLCHWGLFIMQVSVEDF